MKKRSSAIKYTSRHMIVERIRREVERRGFPRLQMLLLVLLTGGAGFLASYGLLHAGVETLAWRYGLAVAIAYSFFLLLLWLWLRTGFDDYTYEDVLLEIADSAPSRGGGATQYEGGGGEFSGGGASGHWEESSEPLLELPDMPDVSGVADADEAAIPIGIVLAVVAVVVTVMFASLSVVWSAPVLFAELLLDGVLAATLYRRLRRLEPRHWLRSALRRTLVPFGITALLMMAAGWGMSVHAPAARSLGDVLATL